ALAKGYRHTRKAYKGYVGQTFWGQVRVGFKPDKINKSGFFEIYSAIMKDKGLPALPSYKATPEHEQMKPDDLILTTYKVNVQSHSRTQNCKWLSEIYHDNPAWINPATASARGIRDGDLVKVKSDIGVVETKVLVTQGVAPGVIAISMHCGHWEYGRYASGKNLPLGAEKTRKPEHVWWSDNGVHPNWIIPNSVDPITGQQRWMDTVVSVTKA
ncbi:MAG: DMSO reductase, partial [Rhodospirillaceae bacterium]|nr:DMSO reductase [Rhodospirillaceae bacterium]